MTPRDPGQIPNWSSQGKKCRQTCGERVTWEKKKLLSEYVEAVGGSLHGAPIGIHGWLPPPWPPESTQAMAPFVAIGARVAPLGEAPAVEQGHTPMATGWCSPPPRRKTSGKPGDHRGKTAVGIRRDSRKLHMKSRGAILRGLKGLWKNWKENQAHMFQKMVSSLSRIFKRTQPCNKNITYTQQHSRENDVSRNWEYPGKHCVLSFILKMQRLWKNKGARELSTGNILEGIWAPKAPGCVVTKGREDGPRCRRARAPGTRLTKTKKKHKTYGSGWKFISLPLYLT